MVFFRKMNNQKTLEQSRKIKFIYFTVWKYMFNHNNSSSWYHVNDDDVADDVAYGMVAISNRKLKYEYKNLLFINIDLGP